jgi:hypothetical protein
VTPKTGSKPLICAECGVESPPDAAGWRGYLDDDGAAVMFCPDCAEREFGAIFGRGEGVFRSGLTPCPTSDRPLGEGLLP